MPLQCTLFINCFWVIDSVISLNILLLHWVTWIHRSNILRQRLLVYLICTSSFIISFIWVKVSPLIATFGNLVNLVKSSIGQPWSMLIQLQMRCVVFCCLVREISNWITYFVLLDRFLFITRWESASLKLCISES